MWPWGHLAVGYLCYVGWRRYTTPSGVGITPVLAPLVFLMIGTQFPDLIDKPLAWTADVLPTGRSLAHSAPVAMLITLSAVWFLDLELGISFTIGYWSHLLADAIWPLLSGQINHLTFLLWPVLPSPTYEVAPSFDAHFAALTMTPQVTVEFALFAFAVGHYMYMLDGLED